jgi:glutathione S-transferase
VCGRAAAAAAAAIFCHFLQRPAPGKTMKLFGTPTSPYTRKIRILTAAANLEVEMVDTRTEAGAEGLMAVAPLGKVPVIDDGGLVIPDSSVITGYLWARHGQALRAAGFDLDPANLEDRIQTVIVDGALDAAINRFYLRRDGFEDRAYVARQRDRAHGTLAWLDARITFDRPITAARLALGVALDWMIFRQVTDLGPFPNLAAFRAAWRASGIGAATEPAT